MISAQEPKQINKQTNKQVRKTSNQRSSQQRCSMKKSFLRNFTKFTGKHLLFSCEFCEISKSTFVTEQLWATVSLTNLIRLIGGERKKQSEKGERKNRIKTPLKITMEKITVMKIINRWKYKYQKHETIEKKRNK